MTAPACVRSTGKLLQAAIEISAKTVRIFLMNCLLSVVSGSFAHLPTDHHLQIARLRSEQDESS